MRCAEIAQRYEAGESMLAVAASLKIYASSVRHSLLRHRIKRRPSRGTRWADAAYAEYEQGLSFREIGQRHGVTGERARQVLAERFNVRVSNRRRHPCSQACEAVGALQPVVAARVAKALGLPEARVRRIIAHHGFSVEQRIEAIWPCRHACGERCEQIKAMLVRGMNRNQISAALGIKPTAIYGSRLTRYHPDWPWFDGRTLANRLRRGTRRGASTNAALTGAPATVPA